jgi:hypothetical protein
LSRQDGGATFRLGQHPFPGSVSGFGCLEHHDRGGHNEGVLKRAVLQVIKMAMVLAVVVFVITPVYTHGQFILLIGSIALFLICLFLLKNLDGENSPWWPEKPRH